MFRKIPLTTMLFWLAQHAVLQLQIFILQSQSFVHNATMQSQLLRGNQMHSTKNLKPLDNYKGWLTLMEEDGHNKWQC
jgi:hypothetical protein